MTVKGSLGDTCSFVFVERLSFLIYSLKNNVSGFAENSSER